MIWDPKPTAQPESQFLGPKSNMKTVKIQSRSLLYHEEGIAVMVYGVYWPVGFRNGLGLFYFSNGEPNRT